MTNEQGQRLPKRGPLSPLERIVEGVVNIISADGSKAYKVCGGVAAVVFVVASALLVITGPLIQRRYGHDTAFFLDGGWKVYWGYKPHVDFYCPVVLDFLLVAAGMKIAGLTAKAIPVGNALFGLAATALTWWSARRRLSAPLLLLLTLFVGFVALSAHQLRFPFNETTYTILYNRHGYALIALFSLLLFVEPHGQSSERDLTDGIVVGSVWVLMFFVKITFFLAGGAFVLTFLLLRRSARRWTLGVVIGALTVGIAFLAYLNFNVIAIINDLSTAAAARRGTITLRAPISFLLSLNYQIALLFVMGLLLVLSPSFPKNRRIGSLAPPTFIALVFIGCSAFIMSTNAPDGIIPEAPLLVVPALILMAASDRALRRFNAPKNGRDSNPAVAMHFVLLLIGAMLVGRIVLRDAASVAYGIASSSLKASRYGSSDRINTPSMSNMVYTGVSGDPHYPNYPTTYADKINDGVRLLDENVSREARVESFDFMNSFPFASLRPPNKGGAVGWQVGFTINAQRYPSAERTLANADAVMIPRYPGNPGAPQLLLNVYADYLREHFALKAESQHWFLLTRKAAGSSEPEIDLEKISAAIQTDYAELHGALDLPPQPQPY